MERRTRGATTGTTIVPPNRSADHGEAPRFGDTTQRIHHRRVVHTDADLCMQGLEERGVCVGEVAMNGRNQPRRPGGGEGGVLIRRRMSKKGRIRSGRIDSRRARRFGQRSVIKTGGSGC